MNESIRGFAFPFRIDGGVVARSGADKLRENLENILWTGVGERVMRREYGGGLRQLLHDPNNDALRAIAQHQVAKAMARFEPRVLVQDIRIAQDAESGTLWIRIEYIVRRTRQAQTLSMPVGLDGSERGGAT